jgi:hypothetical protein
MKVIAPKHERSCWIEPIDFKYPPENITKGIASTDNSEFVGPLFQVMACDGIQIYAKTQISYWRLPDSDLYLYLRYAKNDFRCSTQAIDVHYNCRA